MSPRINDISSLFSLGRLNKTQSSLTSTLEKLSTGRRINKAADDASGLAIADSLESQRRGYVQSIRNATDAISIVQTADGAIGEMTNILQEMRTKAIQAASDSQSYGSRQALQADINRQLRGLNNIVQSTSYNNQKLLSGQFTDKSFQVGAVSGEVVTVNIGDISPSKLGSGASGSSTPGNRISGTELTANVLTQSDVVTTVESRISSGSQLAAQTQLAAGSSTGFNLNDNNLDGDIATTQESNIQAGSTLGAGSVVAAGTEFGGTVTVANNVATINESTVSSGSTLAAGTVIGSGTTLSTSITAGGTTYNAGDTLASDITLTSDTVIGSETTLSSGSVISSGSTLSSSSNIGGDVTLANSSTVTTPTTLESGSTISDSAGTNILSGSTIGGELSLAADTAVMEETSVTAGSSIGAGSTIGSGSTLGGQTATANPLTLGSDITIGAGSILESGSILSAGTILTSDIQVTGGEILREGSILGNTVVTEGQNQFGSEITLKAGSTLSSGSIISPQVSVASGGTGNAQSSSTATSLNEIDLTSVDGAQSAIEIIDLALSELNQARSGLGSTQNQLESSVANLSVTMVNTAAAESTIADLDFAEESINLNRFQILMKAQVFAQAQTSRIKGGNIMNLLQG